MDAYRIAIMGKGDGIGLSVLAPVKSSASRAALDFTGPAALKPYKP